MTQQQITIDYTVAATKRLPEISVHLVLTYDDAQKRTKLDEKRGAYEVATATGTYSTTAKDGTPETFDIVDLRKKHHLGNNDNKVYPGTNSIVDKHGLTFDLAGTHPHAPKLLQQVNLFDNPRGGDHLQQYTSYKSRDLATISVSGPTPVESTAQVRVLDVAAPLCFAAGTRIATARGDVAVEALEVGDLAVTASGALRPIKWLGRRAVDLRQHHRATEMAPVRIAANAFGPASPARDLYLSPGHPVLVGADADNEGGHLVPIMCLVNGTTIERVRLDQVTYWHVELDSHDILMAEGLPAESYLELGDRAFFAADADGRLASPDLVVPGIGGRCRPVAIDGAVVEVERDRLDMVFATRLTQACRWPGADAALDF